VEGRRRKSELVTAFTRNLCRETETNPDGGHSNGRAAIG
jgi:hypothetical protein